MKPRLHLHLLFMAALAVPFSCQHLFCQQAGGSLTVAATEPKTLNPFIAADQPSRDVIYALSADLVHINRGTLTTEPALAKSWRVSRDGKQYTVTLRAGLRFSDGSPLTADDVVFTFQAHLDPQAGSTQRDLLLINGRPISVTRLSADTVRFDLPATYGPGERLFDGFWILPRTKLATAFREGRLSQVWGLGAPPEEIAGTGPFRLKQRSPGQRLVLERNPYYWKKDDAGRNLPYLDRLEFSFGADQNLQLLRLRAGEVDVLQRLRSEDFASTGTAGLRSYDAGPGLEYNFVAFNWNTTEPARTWFRDLKFRQAVAYAVDRDAIVNLAYQGKASPIWSQVTPGNRLWRNDQVTRYPHDLSRASALLKEAGFRRDSNGSLRDAAGRAVQFTLQVSASNLLRRKIATLVEEDLAQVGIRAHSTPTEFASMVDAVLHAGKYEAVLWALASGDADPTSEMNVWPSAGSTHLWNLRVPGQPPPPVESWERAIDELMDRQMTLVSARSRKMAYDKVQQILAENQPVVFLVSPHVLAAAGARVGGFAPAILEPVVIWNCERWYRVP